MLFHSLQVFRKVLISFSRTSASPAREPISLKISRAFSKSFLASEYQSSSITVLAELHTPHASPRLSPVSQTIAKFS